MCQIGIDRENRMAEGAVTRELLSAKFPANRENYRDIQALITNPEPLSPDCTAVWARSLRCLREPERGKKGLAPLNPHKTGYDFVHIFLVFFTRILVFIDELRKRSVQ